MIRRRPTRRDLGLLAVVLLGGAAVYAGFVAVVRSIPGKALPQPVSFEDPTWGWRGDVWEVCEVPVVHTRCGEGARLLRGFVTRYGSIIPAEPVGGDRGALPIEPMIDLKDLDVGRHPRICVRFRPPRDVVGYQAWISVPEGACGNGYAGERPLLSPNIPPRPAP